MVFKIFVWTVHIFEADLVSDRRDQSTLSTGSVSAGYIQSVMINFNLKTSFPVHLHAQP